ncbi:MAG: hypothetical protein DCC68_17825 [Planctomycetota bacterium]|nr:MAG: hypothetical protein DCC68_17825 [Planctomycetota bacterium]
MNPSSYFMPSVRLSTSSSAAAFGISNGKRIYAEAFCPCIADSTSVPMSGPFSNTVVKPTPPAPPVHPDSPAAPGMNAGDVQVVPVSASSPAIGTRTWAAAAGPTNAVVATSADRP